MPALPEAGRSPLFRSGVGALDGLRDLPKESALAQSLPAGTGGALWCLLGPIGGVLLRLGESGVLGL